MAKAPKPDTATQQQDQKKSKRRRLSQRKSMLLRKGRNADGTRTKSS